MLSTATPPTDPPTPLLTLEQVEAVVGRKFEELIDRKLTEFRADIQRVIDQKASHDQVDAKIQQAVQPLSNQLTLMSSTLSSIQSTLAPIAAMQSELAEIKGSVVTLREMRGGQLEDIRSRIAEHHLLLNDFSNESGQMRRNLDEIRYDFYGNPANKDGMPSFIEMTRQQHRETMDQIAKLSGVVGQLSDQVKEDHKYIVSRKELEKRVVAAARQGIVFVWTTWRGRAILAGSAFVFGVVALEQQYPGITRALVDRILSP